MKKCHLENGFNIFFLMVYLCFLNTDTLRDMNTFRVKTNNLMKEKTQKVDYLQYGRKSDNN